MTEEEVVQILLEYFDSLFPRVCPSCHCRFETLSEYILVTKRLGNPVSYDADEYNWNTKQPIGTVVFANCPCGTTLALTTEKMPLPQRLALLRWVGMESRRRCLSPSDLLEDLRNKIRRRVLGDLADNDLA